MKMETILISLLLSSTLGVPIASISSSSGIPFWKLLSAEFILNPREILMKENPMTQLGYLLGFSGMLVSWISAIPMILDWGVWWQEWPIPLIIGTPYAIFLALFLHGIFMWRRGNGSKSVKKNK